VGGLPVSGQSLVVIGAAVVLLAAMYVFFERSIIGKALRATAINRVGARLMGIPTDLGRHLLCAGRPHRRRLRAADRADHHHLLRHRLPDRPEGLRRRHRRRAASYPLAVVGALLVGQLESFSSFWASAFKEVIVFTLIIPVLWWRSSTPPRGGRGMTRRHLTWLAIALLALSWPLLGAFTVTLLNYIGLYSLVAVGLVMLTGVGGITPSGRRPSSAWAPTPRPGSAPRPPPRALAALPPAPCPGWACCWAWRSRR
jgi:hypothetical protein